MNKIQAIKNEIERLILEYSKQNKQDISNTLKMLLHFIDSLPEEPASEDLEEEIEIYSNNVHFPICYDDYKRFARHFADWQERKDTAMLERAYDNGVNTGKDIMKQQMMKDAVGTELSSGMKEKLNVSGNYKAYIIVIKEDNQ